MRCSPNLLLPGLIAGNLRKLAQNGCSFDFIFPRFAPVWRSRGKLLTVPRGRLFWRALGRSNRFALQRRAGKKEEALGLKRLLHSLSGASVAVILAATNTVGASDKQTLDPAQDNAGGEADPCRSERCSEGIERQ